MTDFQRMYEAFDLAGEDLTDSEENAWITIRRKDEGHVTFWFSSEGSYLYFNVIEDPDKFI